MGGDGGLASYLGILIVVCHIADHMFICDRCLQTQLLGWLYQKLSIRHLTTEMQAVVWCREIILPDQQDWRVNEAHWKDY